jgi:dipeptidyl aminopeptidase/acylaminoacyl peptidase
MRRLEFKTRDGAGLFAYVTEAAGSTGQPRPLVVLPHGGPTVRDTFSFDSLTQYLATRGYVVIQPNFRGSGGFGRKFAELGYGEWGGRMHQDVMDATRALVAEGKVDPKRICIVGGSYGGYEAMYSAATEPDTFKCAVSFDGVSDLVGIVKFERTFGTDTSTWSYWRKSEGDPATDSAKMLAHSPYRMAANWKTPILLIHGDKDDIVPVEESRQMNRALQAAGKPVRYVEVQGMGHGPSSDEEITKVYSEIAMFLAQYLGEAPAPASPAPAAKPGR